MRKRSGKLAEEFAADIAEQMPKARRAYGQQKAGSEPREASDLVNALLLEYDQQGGNITELSEHLDGVITLAGLRRRLRVARSGAPLGQQTNRSFRGDRDPEKVSEAAARIKKLQGTNQYGPAIRQAYDSGLALSALAKELDVSYFSAWSSMTTGGEKLAHAS
jgi:transposase-like protein